MTRNTTLKCAPTFVDRPTWLGRRGQGGSTPCKGFRVQHPQKENFQARLASVDQHAKSVIQQLQIAKTRFAQISQPIGKALNINRESHQSTCKKEQLTDQYQ